MTPRARSVRALQRLVVRFGRHGARPTWARAYAALARIAAWCIARGEKDTAVFLRGGGDEDDFLPGLTDLDLALVPARDPVAPGAAAARLRGRWERLRRAFPPATLVVDWPHIHEDAELAALCGQSALTFGLDDRPRSAAYHGEGAGLDRLRLLERPGLYDSAAAWRLLSGPDRRPPEALRDRQSIRIAAWLELAYWWRWAFRVCAAPVEPRASDMCVKFVAEPVRVWLWLVHGERTAGRLDALRRALPLMPEEERALRWALEVHRSLPASPEAPLAEALPAMVRVSARIADAVAAEVDGEERTDVRLSGAPAAGALPLADWRALACPPRPSEWFQPQAGDPGDPALVGCLAASAATGVYPALVTGDLMVLPGAPLRRSRLRSVQCPLTDPVSFALARGSATASFPDVRGWSAQDAARRAVAEHAAWIGAANCDRPLEMLLVAARAALFSESLDEGRPELTLTLDETARRLAERAGTGGLSEDLGVVRRLVGGLPAFAGAATLTSQPAR